MSRSWLIVPLLILYLLDLGGVGFISTDEPRYASIGREMARSGDWVTPRLDGEAWFDASAKANWPMVIHTRDLVIEILGTRFKIDAYRNKPGEEVDVLSGSLRVRKSYHSDTDNEPETLKDGEMVMINHDIDLMEKEALSPAELQKLKEEW